jgi:hypothetical protein
MSGSRLTISTERPEQQDVIGSLVISFVCPNKFKAAEESNHARFWLAQVRFWDIGRSRTNSTSAGAVIERAVQGRSAAPMIARPLDFAEAACNVAPSNGSRRHVR